MAVSVLLFLLVLSGLFYTQLAGGSYYQKRAEQALGLEVPVAAPRGDITDRSGTVLVTEKEAYAVTFTPEKAKRKQQNRALLALMPQMQQTFATHIESQEQAALCKKYEIDPLLSAKEQLLLCAVYRELEQNGAKDTYTLLYPASLEVLLQIQKNALYFPGFSVEERSARSYPYPTSCAHLLGNVGAIEEADLADYRARGYETQDTVGKSGAEKAFEAYLKGTKGVACAKRYRGTALEKQVIPRPPQQGNTVLLTIDLPLQQAAEQALAQAVAPKAGGAAVAVEVKSGEILAAASCPTYDLTAYRTDYSALSAHPDHPLFHRALTGLYEPGSTFKPITAIAALEQGQITPEETMVTKGVYSLSGTAFRCNIYKKNKGTHGTINVSRALGVSCNYFFYEAANRTGISAIFKTAEALGLGEPTGVELFEESGQIACPENRLERGGSWYPGDTLQAAIGQSDNLFTPLALASYGAALANGGTVYKTTLLKAVVSPEGEALYTASPTVRKRAQISKSTLSAVKDGMCRVTESGGTAAGAFSGFPVAVAGKTGSAQVPGGTNGLFVCYAPAEAPQIAVSVVLEKGDSGAKAAKVARAMLDCYFQAPREETKEEEPNFYTLLP